MYEDRIYKNCAEIPIFNFFELVKTKDLKFLLKPGYQLEEFNEERLSKVVLDMLTEYNALTNNSKLVREYQDHLDIAYYEARYNLSKKIISMYLEHDAIEILMLLKDLNWDLDELEPIQPQLKKISGALIGLKNKLKIKKASFKRKYKHVESEDTSPETLEKQVLYLESAIPLHYRIDIYTDSISRFVYWNEILDNKNKQLQNG